MSANNSDSEIPTNKPSLPRTPGAAVGTGARAKTPPVKKHSEQPNPDIDRADLLQSIAVLERENEDLELSVKFNELSRKNSDLKQRLLGKSDPMATKKDKQDLSVENKKQISKKKGEKLPSVKDLREDSSLTKKADKLKKACVIQCESDSSDSSDDDSEEQCKDSQGTNFYQPFATKTLLKRKRKLFLGRQEPQRIVLN